MKSELSIEKIKNIEVDILKVFDSYCRKNNLKYTLAGGTLLGAVRHQGFIPWDDDIDVSMKREDYNKLISNFNNQKSHYKLLSASNNDQYGFLYSIIYDDRTIIFDEHLDVNKLEMGAFIEIFPIDNIGKTKFKSYVNYYRDILLRYTLIASNWLYYKKSKNHSIIREPLKLFFFAISRFCNSNKLAKTIDKRIASRKIKNSKYMCVYCGVYKTKEIFENNIYDELIELSFENKKYYCIKNYDLYLKQFYGDYMKLPPIEKRISHHSFIVYNKE